MMKKALFILLVSLACIALWAVMASGNTRAEDPNSTRSSETDSEDNSSEAKKTDAQDEREPRQKSTGESQDETDNESSDPNQPILLPFEEEEQEIAPLRGKLYEQYQKILAQYVNEEGKVHYSKLRRQRADLYAAMRTLAEINLAEFILLPRDEKIAFWINVYNLCTLRMVVDHYPIQPKWYNRLMYPDNSVIHIPGAWTKIYFDICGQEYTLQEIEREILLGKYADPRVFFGLCFATQGGPFLRTEPYTGEKLDAQLDEQIRRFLAAPRGLRIDRSDREVQLADLFNWYEPAFAKYEKVRKFREKKPKIRAFLNFILEYADEETIHFLESGEFEVRFIRYDWELNDQS